MKRLARAVYAQEFRGQAGALERVDDIGSGTLAVDFS